jgi:ABC-type oligopeptide transport system substrate-binding subunit
MRMMKTSVLVLGTVVLVGLGGAVSAQSKDDASLIAALRAVPSTIDSMEASIGSLAATVNQITSTFNAVTAVSDDTNVLFTSTQVALRSDSLACTVTNVSNGWLNVTVQLLNAYGGAELAAFTADISSGWTRAVFKPSSNTQILEAFCKITVNNGTKNQVRGNLKRYDYQQGKYVDPLTAF